MRDSHCEQVPDRSILVAGHGLGSGGQPLAGAGSRADADSGSLPLSPVRKVSSPAWRYGRGVPRRVAPAACEFGTGPVTASAAHPCGRRSMHARSAARHAIGLQLAFGRSGFRGSRAFHVEPGQPRCSSLEDAASAWEHEAHNAERPQSPALHSASELDTALGCLLRVGRSWPRAGCL